MVKILSISNSPTPRREAGVSFHAPLTTYLLCMINVSKAFLFAFIDIDECSAIPSVCDVNANCQNKVGSYLCTCKPGFVGDGKTCSRGINLPQTSMILAISTRLTRGFEYIVYLSRCWVQCLMEAKISFCSSNSGIMQ